MDNNKNELHPLLRRAMLFLQDENWGNADDCCEQYLNINPECAYAYVIKLMARIRVMREEELALADRSFKTWNSYLNAYRFADEELRSRLSSYADAVEQRLLEAEQKKIQAEEERQRQEIEKKHESIYCRAIKYQDSDSVEDIQKAMELYALIPDYLDVESLSVACAEKLAMINEKLQQKKEEERLEQERRIKKQAIISLIFVLILSVVLVIGIILSNYTATQARESLIDTTYCYIDTSKTPTQVACYKTYFTFKEDGTVDVKYLDSYDYPPFRDEYTEKNRWDETVTGTSVATWDIQGWIFGITTLELNGQNCKLVLDGNYNVVKIIIGAKEYTIVDIP